MGVYTRYNIKRIFILAVFVSKNFNTYYILLTQNTVRRRLPKTLIRHFFSLFSHARGLYVYYMYICVFYLIFF